jgi:hypothetical protein
MVEVFGDGWWREVEGGRKVFLGVSMRINVLVPTSSTRVKCTR